MPKWIKRRSGVETAALHFTVYLFREDWESLKKIAEHKGTTPRDELESILGINDVGMLIDDRLRECADE